MHHVWFGAASNGHQKGTPGAHFQELRFPFILRPMYSRQSRYILAAVMNALVEMARFYLCIPLLILVTLLMRPYKVISEMTLL
jgi:hypothetical protein